MKIKLDENLDLLGKSQLEADGHDVMRPTSTIIERIQRLVASKPVEWRRIVKGYTVAERWVAQLENGTSIFVKRATDEDTAGWLRAEYLAYETLKEEFLPKLIAWED